MYAGAGIVGGASPHSGLGAMGQEGGALVDVRDLGSVVNGVPNRARLWELEGDLVVSGFNGAKKRSLSSREGVYMEVHRAAGSPEYFYQHDWIGQPLGGTVTRLVGNDLVDPLAWCRDGNVITWWGPGDAEYEMLNQLGPGIYPGAKVWAAYWRGSPQKGGIAFLHYYQLPGQAVRALPFRVFGDYGSYLYQGPSRHQYTETGARELCGEADLPPLGVDPTQFPDPEPEDEGPETETGETSEIPCIPAQPAWPGGPMIGGDCPPEDEPGGDGGNGNGGADDPRSCEPYCPPDDEPGGGNGNGNGGGGGGGGNGAPAPGATSSWGIALAGLGLLFLASRRDRK